MSNETMTLKVIAHIHTAFPTKFGIPRQSGLVDGRTAPASLAALRQKAERFNTVIDPEQIAQVALSYQE